MGECLSSRRQQRPAKISIFQKKSVKSKLVKAKNEQDQTRSGKENKGSLPPHIRISTTYCSSWVLKAPISGKTQSSLESFLDQSLPALFAVLSLKVYTYVMVTFLKKEVPCNPLAKVAELNLEIPEEKISSIANNASTKLNATLLELRRLFLVENMLDSIKFGLSLWVLTYIVSWFNAMTLVLISWAGLFTIPKVYILNKAQIGPVMDKVKAQFDEISGKVFGMIPPQAKPAEKTE